MPGRSYSSGTLYRYGFNGKENDNEVKGTGNQQDYGMRIYDPRIGKFLSVDPLTPKYPELTPYQFASNRVIDGIDQDGLEYIKAIPKFNQNTGNWLNDHVAAFDNGVIGLFNIIPDTWNSAVANYQSLKKGTWTKDVISGFKQMGGGINQASNNLVYHPLKTLNSPEALEFLTSVYFGAKIPIPGGGSKGNLMAPVKSGNGLKLSADLPPGIQVAGFSTGGGSSFSKFAFQFGKCVEFAAAFKNDFAKIIESSGGQIKTFEINIGKNGLIGTAVQQLANNGLHRFVEVTMGDQVKIFDNFHPAGVLKEQYMKQIAGYSEGKVIEGEQLLKNAKEVKQ